MAKPKWLEPLEQVGHFWIGLGCSLIFADVLYWRRERIKQWPPADDKHPIIFVEQTERKTNNRPTAYWDRDSIQDEAYYPSSRVIDMMNDIHAYITGSMVGSIVKCVLVGLLGWYIGRSW